MTKNNGEKFLQRWFIPVLIGYVILSIAFQVSYPYFFQKPAGLTEEIALPPCYDVRARLPLSLPILYEDQSSQARQATFWLWKTDPACADEVNLSFSSSEDIIWLNHKQEQVPPSIQAQVGESESQAPRYSLYVYTPVRRNPSTQFNLKVYLDDQPAAEEIPLNGQSPTGALFWGFLSILFNTPSLTMVAGALATGFGIFQTYKNLESARLARQRELEADIEKLKLISGRAAAEVGNQYLFLKKRIEKWGFGADDVVLSTAEQVFHAKKDEYTRARIWAFSYRKEIARRLTAQDLKAQIEPDNKVIQFLSNEEINLLLSLAQANKDTPFERWLERGLQAFDILGVDNVRELCKVIAAAVPLLIEDEENAINAALQQVKDKWFNSGASGRYLSGQLAEVESGAFFVKLKTKLIEWEKDEEYPPNQLRPNAALWTAELVYAPNREMADYLENHHYKPHLSWFTPFGPIKAECDPRLPRQSLKEDKRRARSLFWDEHPLWEKVLQAKPLCVEAGAGMGTSAMILMGRHMRRFWGRMPALSIPLTLYGKADEADLWARLEKALFEQIICDLTEDPFWLLNAPASSQQMIASFLIRQAGDFNALLLKLDEAGIPERRKEREVLGLALFEMSEAAVYQSRRQFAELLQLLARAMQAAARPRMKDPQFYIFLWVEFKSADGVDEWLDLLERTGLNALAILKFFVPAPLYSLKVRSALEVESLRWRREDLQNMLERRIRQVNLPLQDFPLEALLDEAQGSPAKLIAAGNAYKFESKTGVNPLC